MTKSHAARLPRWLAIVTLGAVSQSTCFLESEFDAVTLFADVTSRLLTDTIFFALDSFLVSIG